MIVLNTHILIWWVSANNKLSEPAQKAITHELNNKGETLISSITAWEISMLVTKNRLNLTMDIDSWLQLVSEIEQVKFMPVNNKVAIESTRLPGEFHKDPADRMITALARTLSIPLITADKKIRRYQHVNTIW
ncbi:MAG: type II toxin-antitoxin system VapC family toxin [Alteromonadaceae bacterium]|nr:type II toxin-antitoxin system VapC family toxin [Alteromonadaceae bacterium]